MRTGTFQADAKVLIFCLALFASLAAPRGTNAAVSLSTQEARKLIARMPGLALKTKAIHIKKVSSADNSTNEVTAEITTVFRVEKNDQAQWRVAEVRTGQDGWQEIEPLVQAVNGELNGTTCDTPDPAVQEKRTTDPSTRRSRCLLAVLLGVQLPSDAVRIKSVSAGLPLGSHQSALVEALIEMDFRFTRDRGSWRVSGVRTGTRAWADPEAVVGLVNKGKSAQALSELQLIAKALEEFRARRGFYVESNVEATLIDSLSPVYLLRVIRIDPWRRPYHYEGTRDRFRLSSNGPDGKDGTPDDIVISGPAHSAAAVRN